MIRVDGSSYVMEGQCEKESCVIDGIGIYPII